MLFAYDQRLEGTYNVLGANSTNIEMTQRLAKWMKRPLFMPNIPAFLRFLLGERATLVLSDLKASNQKIIDAGFVFKYTSLIAPLSPSLRRVNFGFTLGPYFHRKSFFKKKISTFKKIADEKKEKIFVLDTSVLLHDFDAIVNFKEHLVAIPITVLEELDKFKIGNDTKNFSAREVIRFIDKLSGSGSLQEWITLGKGLGKFKVVMDEQPTGLNAEKYMLLEKMTIKSSMQP